MIILKISSVMLLVTVLTCLGAAQAAMLVPGPSSFTPDTSEFTCPGSPGVPCPDAKTGILQTGILRNVINLNGRIAFVLHGALFFDPNNVFCAGCLDLFYQITNSARSLDAISRVTLGGYTGWMTDVGFITNGSALPFPGLTFVDGTTPPALVDRLSTDVVGFDYNSPIPPGSTSMLMFIETDAKGATYAPMDVIAGGVSTDVPDEVFAPSIPYAVPEPSSLSLLGLGLLLAFMLRARSNRPA